MNPSRAVTRPRLDAAERKLAALAALDDPAPNPTPPLPRHPHKTPWVPAGTKAVRLP